MTDTLEVMANGARDVIAGNVSPKLAMAAGRCGAATEFKARRLFLAAMSRFRSDLQDTAALSPAFNTQLLRFIAIIGEHAPTIDEWDAAMARREAMS